MLSQLQGTVSVYLVKGLRRNATGKAIWIASWNVVLIQRRSAPAQVFEFNEEI